MFFPQPKNHVKFFAKPKLLLNREAGYFRMEHRAKIKILISMINIIVLMEDAK